jgi:3-hydroxy acid dehydrogenase/malonic semialdehyde reductase
MAKERTVFITGASSGIGMSCAHKFAQEGANLLLCARRVDRLEKLKSELFAKHPHIHIHVFSLDVRNNDTVVRTLSTLPDEWKQVDILVNNAGLSRGLDKFQDASVQDWEEMIDTNIKGLLYVSKAILPVMLERGKGHIINIGSIAGREVYPRGHVYSASKHAVDAITKGLRMDLVDTPLRVTTVDPGLVETEFSVIRFRGNEEKAKAVYQNLTPLSPDDVADAVVWAATRPAHVQIADIVIFPTAQSSAAVVHRG